MVKIPPYSLHQAPYLSLRRQSPVEMFRNLVPLRLYNRNAATKDRCRDGRSAVLGRIKTVSCDIFFYLILIAGGVNVLYGVVCAAEAAPRNLLVLNSYHPGYSWSDGIMGGLQEGFTGSDKRLKVAIEYMDCKKYPPEKVFPVLESLYQLKYGDHLPDLLIVCDNNALDFALARREKLFHGVPIVFCGINNYCNHLLAGQAEITGVAETHDYEKTLALVRRLHPGRKNFVAVCDHTISATLNRELFRLAAAKFPEVETLYLSGLTTAELKIRLQALPQDAVIFHLDYYRDREGRSLTIQESFALIRQSCHLPIYVFTDNKLGFGAIGGYVTSSRLQGLKAARMALRIIAGEPASSIAIECRASQEAIFDYKFLEEFGISLAQLPEASRIINQPRSLYYQYRKAIWLTFLFIACQMFLIGLLLSNIFKRRRSEQQLREVGVKLKESEKQFRHYFEQANLGFALTSLEKGWLRVNERLCEMLGYTAAELKQMTWTEMTFPEDLEPDLRQFERLLAGEIENYNMEKRFYRKDGSLIDTNLTVSCSRNENGTVDFVIATLDDITFQKQMLKKLADSHTHLEEAVAERTAELEEKNRELEQFNKLFVGRELRMVELKEQIANLKRQLGER